MTPGRTTTPSDALPRAATTRGLQLQVAKRPFPTEKSRLTMSTATRDADDVPRPDPLAFDAESHVFDDGTIIVHGSPNPDLREWLLVHCLEGGVAPDGGVVWFPNVVPDA